MIKNPSKRITDHCQCKYCVDGVVHSSDCAVHNEPAEPNRECDCEAVYISVFSEDLSYYWNRWFGDGWTNDKDKYNLFLLIKKELATQREAIIAEERKLMAKQFMATIALWRPYLYTKGGIPSYITKDDKEELQEMVDELVNFRDDSALLQKGKTQ